MDMFLPGHLLSTAEVESALVEHESVAEAAVVGRPHPVKGESLYCFVTLNDGIKYNQSWRRSLKSKVCVLKGLFCARIMILSSFSHSHVKGRSHYTFHSIDHSYI